jgi:hypothetical protein
MVVIWLIFAVARDRLTALELAKALTLFIKLAKCICSSEPRLEAESEHEGGAAAYLCALKTTTMHT